MLTVKVGDNPFKGWAYRSPYETYMSPTNAQKAKEKKNQVQVADCVRHEVQFLSW